MDQPVILLNGNAYMQQQCFAVIPGLCTLPYTRNYNVLQISQSTKPANKPRSVFLDPLH